MQHAITIVDDSRVVQLGSFVLRRTGLSAIGAPTFDEWQCCGAVLRGIESGIQFALGDWLNYGKRQWGEKYTQAVACMGLEQHTLENYAFVAGNLQSSRRREDFSFSVHSEIAALPTAKAQDEWLERAEQERFTRAELRTALRMARRRELLTGTPEIPSGKFRVVYADPPWAYHDSGVIVSSDAYGRAERHYPTMRIVELCDLPIIEHVEDDAVLFLWVTSPLLMECSAVIDAWGFKYKTSVVWDKQAHNFGHYVSVRHEFLLIATRGSCTPDEPTPMPPSVVAIKRTSEHSEKPPEFRQLIEQLYPLGRRLELFGRHHVDGWDVFGNQRLSA